MAGHNLQLGSSTAADSAASNQEILNYDQLAEVFSYLPATNLSRLHLVSKSFHNMITSDTLFHLMQSYHNAAAAGIFVDTYFRLQYFILDPDAGLPRDSLDILSAYDHRPRRILCSAGGLIFYLRKDTIFFSICAYNPVLRRESWLIRIPPGGDIGLRSSLAVEFTNDVTGDYKLVYLTPGEEYWTNFCRCRVYDSAAEVWTRDELINDGGRNLKFDNPVVHRGAVFWASDCFSYTTVDPYVLSYEIATGVAKFLAMPEPDDGAVESDDNISVAVWEESWLCLVHYRRRTGTFTAWGRSGEDSWVNLDEFVYLEKPEGVGTMLACDGGKEKGMLLVFSVTDEAYVYSFRQRDLKRLATGLDPCFPTFVAYANTLRPCLRTTGESRSDYLLN